MDGGERFFFVAVVVIQKGRDEGLLIQMSVEDVHVEVGVGLSSVGGISCLGRRREEAGGGGGRPFGQGRFEGRIDVIVQIGLGTANRSRIDGLGRISTALGLVVGIFLVRPRGKHLTRRGHGGHHLLGNVLGGRFGPRDGVRLANVGRVDHARKRWRGNVRFMEIARVGQPVQSVGLLQELVDVLSGGIPRGYVA